MMRYILFLVFLVSASGVASFASKPAATLHASSIRPASGRPNVIYIIADDLGYGDLASYGGEKIDTPNLDRLAAEGMRFTRHYSGSTVCAPSRCALMTGLHTGHAYVRGNREYQPEGQHPLRDEDFTIAELMKDAGYVTGAFGKWGLGFVATEGDPNNQGFDEFFGYNCQRWAHRYYPPFLWRNSDQVFLPGNDTRNKITYGPDVIQGELIQFLKQHRDEPFFLFVPMVIPHAELAAPEDEILRKYRGRWEEEPFAGREGAAYDEDFSVPAYMPQPEPRATFAAMVERLDQQVGEIVRVVDELGLGENTVIFFTSDNGPHLEGGADPDFFDSNGPLRGYKRDLYEGGIRVPMIARWPGMIQAGSVSDHVSAFWDMLPTLAELTAQSLPVTTDGISFLPELMGNAQADHEFLYWQFYHRHLPDDIDQSKEAVVMGDWKAVRIRDHLAGKERFELYNLAKDPGEKSDLASDNPELVARAKEIMKRENSPSGLFPLPALTQ